MAVPNQTIGLTNFTGSFSACPPNPNAIRAITFTKCSNLSVVNGATTEIQIDLSSFYVPVKNAGRASFTIPAKSSQMVPYVINKMDFGGLDTNGQVKYIAIFPQYGTGASANSYYLEWASNASIETGELYDLPVVGPGGESSFKFFNISQLAFSYGGSLDYYGGGTGSIYAATTGGLLKWDGTSATLFNTLNSNSTTDFLSSIAVDTNNYVWLGTDSGVVRFNEKGGFSTVFTTSNTSLPSNYINCLKLFGVNQGVVGTDNGLSIFDTAKVSLTASYDIYNSPLLRHNYITCVEGSSDPYIFAGTTGGVYVLNPTTSKWNKFPLNSSSVTGWTAPDEIQSVASCNGNLYIGTTGGLVILPYAAAVGATISPIPGVTASVVLGGGTGPYSSNFCSLRVENCSGSNRLYAGHDNGGVSILKIDTNDWYYVGQIDGLSGSNILDVLPDFLTSASDTFYSCSTIGEAGIQKTLISSNLQDYVPGSEDRTDILVAVPGGTAPGTGNYTVDGTKLYSINQPIYLVFSKPMDISSVAGGFSLVMGISGDGSPVTGSATLSSDGYVFTFTPDSPLQRAQGYNLKLSLGCTAEDGSYVAEGLNVGFYTENIDPILGWNPLGKMMVLSGSDIQLTSGFYLRNPQSIDVNIIALIGN